jgi:putative phosphoesterase
MLGSYKGKGNYTVGVISDTHGHMRPEIVRVFKGADLIVHAGDIGRGDILEALQEIAPVVAVRGNMDDVSWAFALPLNGFVEIDNVLLYVLHDISRLDFEPSAAGVKAVINGHSHRPSIERHKGVLYLNPGSAGPRRFKLPISVALLSVRGDSLDARLMDLL